MAKTTEYKNNSLIYFKGDIIKSFYVVKSGFVMVSEADRQEDISDKEKEKSMLANGEFFGVMAALTGRPSMDMALVCSDVATVLELDIKEFICFATSSHTIITTFLKQYNADYNSLLNKILLNSSNESKSVLAAKDTPDATFSEIDFTYYNTGCHFYKNRYYKQAYAIFEMYLKNFTQGEHISEANRNMAEMKESIGTGTDASSSLLVSSALGRLTLEIDNAFNEVKKLYTDNNYKEAVIKLSVFITDTNSAYDKYRQLAIFIFSDTLYRLGRYKESIMFLENYLPKYPSHEKTPLVLFLLIKVNIIQGNNEKSLYYLKELENFKHFDITDILEKANNLFTSDPNDLVYDEATFNEKIDFKINITKNEVIEKPTDNIGMASDVLNKYVKKYKAGDVLYVETEPCNSFFVLRKGRIRLSKVSGNFEKVVNAVDEVGTFFGLEAVLSESSDGTRRYYTAIVTDNTEVIMLPNMLFFKILEKNPVIAIGIIKTFIEGIYELDKQLKLLEIKDINKRIISTLVAIDAHYSMGKSISVRRVITENIEKISSWASVDIDVVRSNLLSLSDLGRIELNDKEIVIKNINECIRLASIK